MSNKVFEYLNIVKSYNGIIDHRKKSRFHYIFLQMQYESKFCVKDASKPAFYIYNHIRTI